MSDTTQILPAVHLGRGGPLVGIQGLGCMAMVTDYYGATNETESLATLERALARGVTLFDTSDSYGRGKNEEFIGPFIRAHRREVTIATKFGIVRTSDSDIMINNRPEHIRTAVEASLRRLGVDVIDLYYMHRRNPEVPLANSVGAMAELVKAGKVRFLGLSEVSAEELRAAHAIHPIAALQTEWSLFSRQAEEAMVPAGAELGIGFVPYSPLGRGQLTGRLDPASFDANDVRRRYARFGEDANTRLVAVVGEVALRHGATTPQVALAWLQHQSAIHGLAVVPIPGTRKPERVDANVQAALLALTPADLAELDALAGRVEGHRSARGLP